MKYIFVAGAPGSKWSSVVKNIYYSSSIDCSDYSDQRTYYHSASGKMDLMHIGAYFDPGMEFSLPESMSTLTKKQAEQLFDAPFSGQGVRIIKSHIFCYQDNIEYLRELWPECPIVMVHRPNDACLGWWVRCGHFNITYPNYSGYYENLQRMGDIINHQNEGIMNAWHKYQSREVFNNQQLVRVLGIEAPSEEHQQDYVLSDVKVKVI